jgi:hypothetical protein
MPNELVHADIWGPGQTVKYYDLADKAFNYSHDVIFALPDRGGDTGKPSSSITPVKEKTLRTTPRMRFLHATGMHH